MPVVAAGEAVVAILLDALLPVLAAPRHRPVVFGLCGAQGSGKTTVSRLLQERLATLDHGVALLSLDDLYLPRNERLALADRVHPLFRTRGVPGTHDVALGHRVIDVLGDTGAVAMPRFDKALDTRIAPVPIAAPVDIILFEGWCVGAKPQGEAALREPVNALERDEDADGRWRRSVDAQLAGPYRALFERIDVLALLAAPGFAIVARWRGEQEAAITGPRAMDAVAIARFVAHYQRLTEHILATMPAYADLTICLDEERAPIRVRARAPPPRP